MGVPDPMRPGSGRSLVVINLAFAAVFLLSAGLQYNDPDPLAWALVYGLGALACLQSGRWSGDWLLPSLVAGICLVWSLTLAPAVGGLGPADLFQPMETRGGAVEIAREVGGLVITGSWMIVLAVRSIRGPG